MITPAIRRALVAGIVLTSAAGLYAQKPTVLFGVVTNVNGVRLGGVEISLMSTALKMVTNDSGEFIFSDPPTGRLKLSARRLGFKPQEHGFKLNVGSSRQEDFELEVIPEMLDSIRVIAQHGNGRMADFWNRRAAGNGAFITRADIERRRPLRPSDMLRTVGGVRVTGDNAMDRPVIEMGRTAVKGAPNRGGLTLGGNCVVTYYVDGSYVAPGAFHMDDISPSSMEAIEIFRGPSEIPPRFRHRETACGVISIWTREPPPRENPESPLAPAT